MGEGLIQDALQYLLIRKIKGDPKGGVSEVGGKAGEVES